MDLRKTYRNVFPENIRRPVYDLRQKIIQPINRITADIFDPNVRNMSTRLLSLKDTFKGERCVIMGNGPSLNKMDLGRFANEYVWGFNRCYLLFDRIEWRPSFYVSVDNRVTPDNADEINALFSLLPKTKFFFPLRFRVQKHIKSAPNVYWFYEKLRTNVENLPPEGHFSLNPSKYISSVSTVAITGLQLAIYMGFNPIYLIGCDTDYQVPETVIAEDKDEYYLVSTKNDDINHFSSDYFGEGKKFHQPNPESMMFHYEQVKRVCDKVGVEICNATVGGKLEVFPRVDYRELF